MGNLITETEIEKAILRLKNPSAESLENINERSKEPVYDVTLVYCMKRSKNAKAKWGDQIFVYVFNATTSAKWRAKTETLTELHRMLGSREDTVEHHFRYREFMHVYNSWETLLQDEIHIGTSEKDIELLKTASVKHPINIINTNGIKKKKPVNQDNYEQT